eukprot:5592901-Amphidinium_carterae.1
MENQVAELVQRLQQMEQVQPNAGNERTMHFQAMERAMRALMARTEQMEADRARGWTTIQVQWQEGAQLHRVDTQIQDALGGTLWGQDRATNSMVGTAAPDPNGV